MLLPNELAPALLCFLKASSKLLKLPTRVGRVEFLLLLRTHATCSACGAGRVEQRAVACREHASMLSLACGLARATRARPSFLSANHLLLDTLTAPFDVRSRKSRSPTTRLVPVRNR